MPILQLPRRGFRSCFAAMTSRLLLSALCGAGLVCSALAQAPAASPSLPDGLYAEITTSRGTVVAQLDFRRAPLTVANFVGLAEGSLGPAPRKPFFNGLTFHRVVPDFVIQGGDPLGTGEGGPGYSFADEFAPGLRHDAAGVLSMANNGPDTNGSQFFITLHEVNRLNYLHSVFGRVVRGIELLPSIRQGDAMQVRILRIGAEAGAFRVDDSAFQALSAKAARYAGKPLTDRGSHFADPDGLLPANPPRAQYFNYKLANFERATGVKVCVRLVRRFVPQIPGETANSLRARLVRDLDLSRRGILALYIADKAEWSLWVGDEQVPAFNPAGLKLHERKQAFIATAREKAVAARAYAQQMSGSDKPLTDSQKLKLEVDEVIDGMISIFESAR